MWYLWALALDGGVAAQLVHWALGVLLALAAVLLARRVVGRDGALLAGAIVLLTPGVTNQMAAALNDVGLATMTTLAVAAWWRGAIDDDGPNWFVLAGLFLGAAAGTKYLAILFTIAWLGTWGVMAWRAKHGSAAWLRGATTMLVLAAAVAGPWYARAAWHRGNPVYPFFHSAIDQAAAPTVRESKLALGRTPWGLATAPWAVTMSPERFGGRGHQLGCVYLAMLPGLLWARRLRGVRVLLGISGAYVLGWFLLRQNVRFLFPLIPLAAAPCVWVWIESRRFPRTPAALATCAVLGMLALGALWPVYRARSHWAVACGLETRVEYLQRTEPSFPAALLANLLVGGDARILSQENRGYYFAADITSRRNRFSVAAQPTIASLVIWPVRCGAMDFST
jgi:4-amino-4-deoxy-L-arabinose transferase-like glycosyltransferase